MKIKISRMLMAAAALTLLSFNACEEIGEADCDIESESNIYTQRATAFAKNPSSAGCSSTKQAAIVLLNKLRNCEGGSDLINEGLTAWQNIDCSDYDY